MNVSGLLKTPTNPFQGDAGFRASGDVEADADKKKMIVAGAAVAGGVVGGIVAYEISDSMVKSHPVNSVTETWKQPVVQNQSMGQIPDDFYRPGGIWGFFPTGVPQREVTSGQYGGTPVLDPQGFAAMESRTQTFTGHGTPMVNWETHQIQKPQLDPHQPYDMSQMPNTHTIDQSWTDSDGVRHESSTTVTDGYWYRFSPNVQYKTVQAADGSTTYQKPDVKFETGVHTALNTTLGIIGGAAVAGTAAWLIQKSLDKK